MPYCLKAFHLTKEKSVWLTATASMVLGLGGCAHVASPAKSLSACRLADISADDAVIKVPFEVIDGRIFVSAQVNDKGPFRFAVDTGASGVGRADVSLVKTLALPKVRDGQSSDGIATATVDMVQLASLELGEKRLENVDVITRDYASRMSADAAFAGIIGREFFADGLLIIDYPARMLTFSRIHTLAQTDSGALGYERPFRVAVTINGVVTQGNLDTGANVNFVLPLSLFGQVSDSKLEPASQGTLTNSKIETFKSTVHGPFAIGDVKARDIEVRVSEKFPELFVGAHFLQSYRLLIDQRSKAVALCP
jgi:hypothetical protein